MSVFFFFKLSNEWSQSTQVALKEKANIESSCTCMRSCTCVYISINYIHEKETKIPLKHLFLLAVVLVMQSYRATENE